VFERTKETDRELFEIRQEEISVKERLHQIASDRIETEQMRRELERLKVENVKLKEFQAKQTKLLNDMTARALESASKIESLESVLSSMKEKIAVCEREHGGAGDVNETKEQLRKVKDAMQSITRYSKSQRNEKEQALRRVAGLERDVLEKEKLQKEVASLKDEILEKEKLQKEVASLKDEILEKEKLHKEVASLKAEILEKEKLHKEVASLKAEILEKEKLQREVASLKAEILGKEKLQKEVASLKAEILEKEKLHREVASLKAEILDKEKLQKEIASLRGETLEKEKLQREVGSVRDEIAALRMISEETQQRQLNEIQSTSTAKETPQQQRAGKVDELMYFRLTPYGISSSTLLALYFNNGSIDAPNDETVKLNYIVTAPIFNY